MKKIVASLFFVGCFLVGPTSYSVSKPVDAVPNSGILEATVQFYDTVLSILGIIPDGESSQATLEDKKEKALERLDRALKKELEPTRIIVLNSGKPPNHVDFEFIKNKIGIKLTGMLARHPWLAVVDRANLNELLKEQEFQHSGAVDPHSAMLMGRVLGAEILILIDHLFRKDTFEIYIKVLDIESGKVLGVSNTIPFAYDGLTLPDLREPSPEMTQPSSVPSTEDLTSSLSLRKVPFTEFRHNAGKYYYFENYFHYYIQDKGFSEDEKNLIHDSYRAVSHLLNYVGYPIQFKYWGEFKTSRSEILRALPFSYSMYNMGIEAFDKKNVIYRGHFTARFDNATRLSLAESFLALFSYPDSSGGEVHTGVGVNVSEDYVIDDVIKEHPYLLGSKRYPCLCEVLSFEILRTLNIAHLGNVPRGWLRALSRQHFSEEQKETTHIHLNFLDIFYKNPTIRQELVQTLSKLTVVESPYVSLVDQTALYELYVAYNGLYLKFKDSFKSNNKIKVLGVTIENEDVGFFKNPVIAKLMSPGLTHADPLIESIFARRDLFFSVPGHYFDPMIAALAVGEFNAVGLRNLPPPGTRVVLKLFYSSDEKAPISTHSFLWPKIPIRDFALGR